MRVTKIDIELAEDNSQSSKLLLTTSDGTVFVFDSHIENGWAGFYKLEGTKNKGIRPNKIDNKVLECLRDFANYSPPSHRKMAEIVGCHYSYIGKAINNLQSKGLIDLSLKPIS